MLPPDFIKAALDLVEANDGKPRQANLRRAISTAYYALFHAMAKCCADTLIGGAGSVKSKEAWLQTYRALQHGAAKSACSTAKIIGLFPQEIQDFANLFVTMQTKRHSADYNPHAPKLFKSAVLLDIQQVETVIEGLKLAPVKDRRAFAALVIFPPPRSA